jgi:RNA polymerase sigma-70 factor (ECF subfamily)
LSTAEHLDSPPLPVPNTVSEELDRLYRAHVHTVTRWVQRLSGPDLDTDDLVHEVFMEVGRLLPRFRGEAHVTTWMYTIAANTVRYHRRKLRWRRWLAGGSWEDRSRDLEAPDPTPAQALEQRQTNELVYRILDGIPDKYRTVLILFELEGLSGEEIAQLTGTKLATVWVWLHRGRQKFLDRMAEVAPDHPLRGGKIR